MTPGLIERLEAAGEGSRELDAEVWVELVECDRLWRYWAPVDEHHGHGEPIPGALYYAPHCAQVFVTPEVTTSLDAALALAERVLPGDPDFEPTGPSVGWKINLYRGMVPAPLGGWIASLRRHASDGVEGSSSSPALALCIAILKARATQEQG